MLGNDDGNFLVRESSNPPNSYTLAIKFSNETKNYKVYYDGAFYVGEKRFDSIIDLVHDGLISFYIEKHASNYIAMMSEENNYSESPYVASKLALMNKQTSSIVTSTSKSSVQVPKPIDATSVHSSFQKQQSATPNTFQQQLQQPTQHQLFQQQFLQHQQQQQQSMKSKSTTILLTREFNTIEQQSTNNSAKQQNAKSNAILDRFQIMNSEKPHCFKAQSFKGPNWCDFCMNFMWGIVNQGVKCQDCGFQAHKKCSERVPPDCEPKLKFIKRIFGVDLTTLLKATGSLRPIIVEKCIEEIETRKSAIETEGLYRVSGFSDIIDELKLAFDRGENVNFNEFKYNDIHII